MGINVNQLEKANAVNKFPLSNNTDHAFELTQLSNADFTVTSNVVVPNPMVYADVIAGNAPTSQAVPPSLPSGLANNSVLIRKYDDLVRIWMKTNGTWAHVFDFA